VRIHTLPAGPISTNGFLLTDEARKEALLIDAPHDVWADVEPILRASGCQLVALLITHGHFDHFQDAVAIAKQYTPEVVCNFEISQYLEKKGVGKLHGINKGGSVTIDGVRVTMVNAVHSSSIRDGDTFYPGGEPCGFVIQFENGKRVYHAGDTAVHSDMKLVGELYAPDVAVLPIGDLFTMAPHEAAHAARMIGAKHVIPIHHSTFPALTGTPAMLRDELKGSGIEV